MDIPTGDYVRKDFNSFHSTLDDDAEGLWFDAVVDDVTAFYGLWDALGDFLVGRHTTYFGEPHKDLPSGANANIAGEGHSGQGAAARQSVVVLGTEINAGTVAHETGHTLNLKHTNTDVPVAGATPPGCFGKAGDPSPYWTFEDNYIQSTASFEYGFDVAARATIDPGQTFEMMSYCTPIWISPISYKKMISTLDVGYMASPSAKRALLPSSNTSSDAGTSGQFWQVRGSVQSGSVTFYPLFELTSSSGNTSQGTGTYTLSEQDAQGNRLFTRLFTPVSSMAETTVPDTAGLPSFSEVVPVLSGTVALVVRDPSNTEIGRITLGGSAPVVTLISPAANFIGSGTKLVSWSVGGTNGGNITYKVLYSKDGGATWSGLGDVQGAVSLPIDFDRLSGSMSAVIRVLVSDGVNTGTATSPLFTVPKKLPSVIEIDNPTSGAVIPAADPVYLSGSAYDADDGVLKASLLEWSSDVQGTLGSGSPLSVHLQPGKHLITLTATDSDGNAVTAATNIQIAGQPPALILQTQALNTAPTTCESATITATLGLNGAPLSLVQYSVDGGSSYATIPLWNRKRHGSTVWTASFRVGILFEGVV